MCLLMCARTHTLFFPQFSFQYQGQEIKEDENKSREGGQAWAGCSLQGYCFFRARSTCLLLRRAIELEMRRDGQMDMWRGRRQGRNPWANTTPSPYCRAWDEKRHMQRHWIATICSVVIKRLTLEEYMRCRDNLNLVHTSNFFWHILSTQPIPKKKKES